MTLVTVDVTRPAPRWRRCLTVELRKVVTTRQTRSALIVVGALWVAVGIGTSVISLLAGLPRVSMSGALLGMGAAVVVFSPIFGIMILAGDWQTRDVVTLFALEPRRHLVFWAKTTAAAILGTVLLIGAAIAAVGGSAITALIAGVPSSWDLDQTSVEVLAWGTAVGIASGVAYGALSQRVAPAIVFSLTQGLLIDPLLSLAPGGFGAWFRLEAISDFGTAGGPVGPALTAALLWLATPILVGYARNRTDVQ